MESLTQDVRYALRGSRREPLFSAFIVATLALGIGANAAMFGVVDRLLIRGPEHITDPARVMRVYQSVRPSRTHRDRRGAAGIHGPATREGGRLAPDVAPISAGHSRLDHELERAVASDRRPPEEGCDAGAGERRSRDSLPQHLYGRRHCRSRGETLRRADLI
jgi:hypothetical protein